MSVFDIKFTRKALRTLVDIPGLPKYIENTWRVSFDIKFTRQGFENAC